MTETLRDPETGQTVLTSTEAEIAARFLALLFDALGSASSPQELAVPAAAALAETIGDWCGIWFQDRSSGALRLSAVAHADRLKAPLARLLADDWQPPASDRLPGRTVSIGRAVSMSVEGEETLLSLFGSGERARLAEGVGCASLLIVPLAAGHRNVGQLVLGSSDPTVANDAGRISRVLEMVRHLSTALGQLHRLEAARHASQQLTLSNLHLQAILDSIPQGVIVASAPEGRVVSASRALAQLLGQPIDPRAPVSSYPQLYGFATPTGETYLPEELPWVHAARTGEVTKVQEMVIHRTNGRGVTVLCSASPVLDEVANVVGSVALLQDISDRKELELQKDEFLAMVAHELKTPLTTVKGYVQLIMRLSRQNPNQALGPRELGMLEVADRQVSRLSQLVFDLLDFSLIRMGRLDLRCVTFDLASLVGDLMEQMQVVAPDREMELVASEHAFINADPHRIEQLVTNLISNAVKATGHGGHIQVRIRRGDNFVVTSVQDDGAGMPRDVQERIFERYYRGPDHYHEGMGLGLYISKGIVDAHSGRIWLESEMGKGTCFHFSLPAAGE